MTIRQFAFRHLAIFTVSVSSLTAIAAPPAIEFGDASQTISISLMEFGEPKSVRVGRPSSELYNYVWASTPDLRASRLDRFECLLVLDLSGNVVTDARIQEWASRVYRTYDNLVPVGSDYDNWILITQNEISQREIEQLATVIIEGAEWVRNTGAKLFITVASGGASAGAAVGPTVKQAIWESAKGYLKSAVVDGLFFGKKAQRASAFLWRGSYIWSLKVRRAVADDLRDGAIIVSPEDAEMAYGARLIIDDTSQPFYDWQMSLYPQPGLEGLGDQLWDMGMSVAEGYIDTVFDEALLGAPVLESLDSTFACLGAKYFGSVGYAFADELINFDMFFKGVITMSKAGVFDKDEFRGTKLDVFKQYLEQSHTAGTVSRLIQTVETAPTFQRAMVKTLYAPDSIADLSLVVQDYTRVRCSWTVPSDDMGTADVYQHEVAYSDRPITNEALWYAAMGHWKYNGAPAGSTKTVTSGELEGGREYYFAVRGLDEDNNYGPLSNSPKITVGEGINPISIYLPDFPVDPEPGSSFADAHTYHVFYKHAGGMEPRARTIYIDGISHGMSRVPGGNYKKGTLFRYRHTLPYAPGSTHTYHYEFTSGPHSKRFPDSGELSLHVDPVLYSESVNPQSSDTYELRTFRVTYRHPEGTWPTRAQLRLNRTQPIDMKMVSGTPLKGATYEARAYINRLNSEFYFDFSDGVMSFRLPASGTLSAAVASLTDVAIVGCDLPASVECGDVIPIRPAIRNAGTEFLTDVMVRFSVNGIEQANATISILATGITRSGGIAFEWNVPQSNAGQQYTVSVSVDSQSGESILANNSVEQLYNVLPGRGSLRGVVYDASGVVPVEGALVQAVGESNIVASSSADISGAFILDGVRAGLYVVIASDSGAKKQVAGLQVNAGQETVVGAVTLDAQGVVQHTHYTGQSSSAFKSLQTSLFDGMIGYYRASSPRGLYLMPQNWSGWVNAFGSWSFQIGYYDFSFSPTRREVVFYATRQDISPTKQGIFRIEYDANGAPLSLTQILDRDIAGYQSVNPVYISDTTVLFHRSIDGTNALWAIERDGSNIREMFPDVPFDYNYTMNSNGTLAVSGDKIYELDHIEKTVSIHTELPSGYIDPRLTHDCSRVLFILRLLGDRQLCSAPLSNPADYTQHTYGYINSRANPAPGWRDERVYDADDSSQTAHANVMSMPFVVPTAYAHSLNSNCDTHNPLVLDGISTNQAVLQFSLNKTALVTTRVLDSQRRLAGVIGQAEEMTAGAQSVSWNGANNYGISVDLGVYYLTLDIQDPDGDPDNVFHYEHVWPVQYGSVTLTNGAQWVAYSPDASRLYVSDSGGRMRRYSMDDGSSELLPVTNVFTFSVNGMGMVVAHKLPDTGYLDYVFYNHDGAGRQFYVQGDDDMYLSPHRAFPGLHPTRTEFVFPAFVPNRNKIMKCTAPGSTTTILASDTMKAVGPRYSQDGSKLILSTTTSGESTADIYEMNANGSGLQQKTIHPKGEMLPRYIPDCSRMLFYANWAGWAHQVWTAEKNGMNPWWLLPYHASYEYNLDLSPNANCIALVDSGQLRIIELPQHLNKGAVRGRVLDDIHAVGLPDVPVRAIQGGNVVASTRSNARGYFKLLNVREGPCEVVAGAGEYLETSTNGVSVAVAVTTDIGDITVIPTPWAALSDPSPGLDVPSVFPVQVQPSERCTHAEFQWRASTNDPWTVGVQLAESNDYSTTFSCVAAAWTGGTYRVRSVGFNSEGHAGPQPMSFSITYDAEAPTLTLSAGTVAGGAALESVTQGGVLAPLSESVPEASVIDFSTTFTGTGEDLNTTVFDVRYPGETNWIPFATRVSTNAPDKSFDSAMVPPNMNVEFRVRSYDHTGNMQTSAVLVVRKDIPGDTDGDGMSDAYENDHGLNMNDPADGEADNDEDGLSNLAESLVGSNIEVKDSDGDGLNDWEEVYCGTSPTNKADVLKALFGEVDPAGGVIVVKWPSADGRFYSLERTTNLLEIFSAIASNLPATPPENSYTDTPVNITSPHFYRIETE